MSSPQTQEDLPEPQPYHHRQGSNNSLTGNSSGRHQVGQHTPLAAAVTNASFHNNLREMAREALNKEAPKDYGNIDHLIENNRSWAAVIKGEDPDFFSELAKAQTPQYLWIGCSDSRVPANQVVGLAPGEVFVHRNIANVVPRSDLNSLSCLSFAVNDLKVDDIIVCGHHGCGGVKAALHKLRLGLVDNWIMHIVDVKNKYDSLLKKIGDEDMQFMALCELNVLSQLCNVAETHVVQDVWGRTDQRAEVEVHGWIYGLDDGLVKPLLTLRKGSDIRMEIETAAMAVAKNYAYRAKEKRSDASPGSSPQKMDRKE